MLRRELAVIKLNSFTSFLVFANIDINVFIKKNDTLTMRRRGGGFSSRLEKRTLVFSILQFILGTITNILHLLKYQAPGPYFFKTIPCETCDVYIWFRLSVSTFYTASLTTTVVTTQ